MRWMRYLALASFVVLLSGCVTNPAPALVHSDDRYADHAVIAQDGSQLTPVSVDGDVYKYVITTGPFSILVPSTDPHGHPYDVATTWVHICGTHNLSQFSEVVPGVDSQDPSCTSSGNARFSTPARAMAGMTLLVGAMTNIVDHAPLSGPKYNTINVARIIDAKGGAMCFLKKLPCAKLNDVKPGEKIYLLIFIDYNNNYKVDAGEYSKIELDLEAKK
jgi:hypothetical protein